MKSVTISLLLGSLSLPVMAQNPPPPAPAGERVQLGIGLASASNDSFGEESGYGLIAELGLLKDYRPISMVYGLQGSFTNGIGETSFLVDIFDVSLMARGLYGLDQHGAIKIFADANLGFGNIHITGKEDGTFKLGRETFKFKNDLDDAAWTFGWGIGFGLQLDFTPDIGFKIGYHLQSYGDMESLGVTLAPGFIHSTTASLMFRF